MKDIKAQDDLDPNEKLLAVRRRDVVIPAFDSGWLNRPPGHVVEKEDVAKVLKEKDTRPHLWMLGAAAVFLFGCSVLWYSFSPGKEPGGGEFVNRRTSDSVIGAFLSFVHQESSFASGVLAVTAGAVALLTIAGINFYRRRSKKRE